ncbi:MAG: DNA helicase RecG, partial [Planctomycetes bacterium]|nr:DNA helicase RecG [Planctomycetota bacterium]
TATPIPRTLALTVFGDLDVSVLDEMPPGRRPVQTRWVPEVRMPEAFGFIRNELAAGRQAFIVYPLVEESEELDLKSATEMAEKLQRDVFPEFKLGLLHGQMKSTLKDDIMTAFRDRKHHVLVSTVVIEVGIDVPNASVMVIEHAERYGLAQLHQLRGRIGRGSHTSYCLLFGDPKSPEAEQRLRVMTQTTDGFRIAEEDLRLRGPGEFFGTRQHGLPELKIANIIDDHAMLRVARQDAFDLVKADPTLNRPLSQTIRRRVMETFAGRLELINVG